MTKFVIRRVLQAIPVLFGITVVVYGILLAAPGGPEAKFANNPRITQEQKDKFIKAWGLDQPIPVQYCRWMGFCNPETEGTVFGSLPTPAALMGPTGLPNFLPYALSGATNGVLHGDFGYSINSGEKVEDRIIRAALPTFILAGVALVVWLSFAIVMGVYSAIYRYSQVRQRVHGVQLRGLRDAHLLAGHHADLHLQRPGVEHPAGGRHDRDPPVAPVRLRVLLGRTSARTPSRRWPTSAST